MNHAAKMDGEQQARNELTRRIQTTDTICGKFRNSYSDYTSSTASQKAAVFFLGLAILVLAIFSPGLIRAMAASVGRVGDPLSAFAVIAVYSICLYLLLYMLKFIIRLSRIAKIDRYVGEVQQIRSVLQSDLGNVDSIMKKMEKYASGNANVKLAPERDIDAEIAEYDVMAESYANPDDRAIDSLLKAAYWISAVLFGVAFLAITAVGVANGICASFKIDAYGLIVVVYAILGLAGFITLHVLLARKQGGRGFGSYLLSLVTGPCTIPIIWAVCGIIAAVIYVVLIAVVIAVIAGIIAAIFSN